jgi:hypothetical protein
MVATSSSKCKKAKWNTLKTEPYFTPPIPYKPKPVKVKNGTNTIINTPIGKDAAKLCFLLSSNDLVQGSNFIRITVKDRTIENLDDFALTNGTITFRGKTKNDNYTDYSKQ